LLREANLIVVPGWRDLDETPRPEITRACATAVEARRARRLDLLRRVLLAHAGLLDGAARPRIGATPNGSRGLFPKVAVEPGRALCRRGQA
jgi:hypothetical protein